MTALISLGNERVNVSDFHQPQAAPFLLASLCLQLWVEWLQEDLLHVASGAGGHCQIVPPCLRKLETQVGLAPPSGLEPKL